MQQAHRLVDVLYRCHIEVCWCLQGLIPARTSTDHFHLTACTTSCRLLPLPPCEGNVGLTDRPWKLVWLLLGQNALHDRCCAAPADFCSNMVFWLLWHQELLPPLLIDNDGLCQIQITNRRRQWVCLSRASVGGVAFKWRTRGEKRTASWSQVCIVGLG